MLVTISLLSCGLSKSAVAEDCRRSDDKSSVTCTSEGYDLLVKGFIDSRAKVKTLTLQLDESQQSIKTRETELEGCLAKLAAVPPPPPPPSITKPAIGFVLGVVGAAATVAAPFLGSAPVELRAGLALGGIGMMAGGFVLILP